jgi:hypothetical protein
MQVGRRKNPKSDFDLKSTKPSRRGGIQLDFRKIILGVVVINILIVVGVVVAYFQLLPKYRVPATIDALAHKYYENVFYENMVTSEKYTGNPAEALSKYVGRGLSRMSLHQIILQTQADAETRTLLEKYCDTDVTAVTFYPEEPYGRDSYHFTVNPPCEVE